MRISELIAYLEQAKEEFGDLKVCTSERHEYWGSVYSELSSEYNLNIDEHAQPDGPKSGKSETCVVFGL